MINNEDNNDNFSSDENSDINSNDDVSKISSISDNDDEDEIGWEHFISRNNEEEIDGFFVYENDKEVRSFINEKPIDVFKTLFHEELCQYIAMKTNEYAASIIQNSNLSDRKKRWKGTNSSEIYEMIGMITYMGIIQLPQISDYWSTNPLYGNNLCRKVMSRNKFQNLLKYLYFHTPNPHLKTPNINLQNRTSHFNSILKTIRKKFQENFKLGSKICIDESILMYNGRLIMKQYNPFKKHKWGIKFWVLCDCLSGYVYNIKCYTGQICNSQKVKGLGGKVVMSLVNNIQSKGHHIFMDNYFVSIKLAKFLSENSFYFTGTINKGKKEFSNAINFQLNKGKIIAY